MLQNCEFAEPCKIVVRKVLQARLDAGADRPVSLLLVLRIKGAQAAALKTPFEMFNRVAWLADHATVAEAEGSPASTRWLIPVSTTKHLR
jgi:hypothetical protein